VARSLQNASIDSFDALSFRVQLFGLGMTALIVIGGAAGITAMISGRMRAMQRTVDAVIAGDLHSRIPLDGCAANSIGKPPPSTRCSIESTSSLTSVKHAAKDVTH